MNRYNFSTHRAGVALLITLVTIAVIFTIIGVLLSTLDSAREDSRDTEAMIQANIYYKDITEFFKSVKEKKAFYSILYQSEIPFESQDESVFGLIACQPLLAGVNINWLGEEESKMLAHYKLTEKLFMSLTDKYNISDPTRLLEMLKEEIEGGKGIYSSGSQNRLSQKKGIVSYRQFQNVINRYQLEVDDPEVSDVPWRKLFSFVPDATVVDGDYMSTELVSLLFGLDPLFVESEWTGGAGTFEPFAKTYGMDFYNEFNKVFAKKFNENIQCDVIYKYAQQNYRFTFKDMKGEKKYFEFYGRQ